MDGADWPDGQEDGNPTPPLALRRAPSSQATPTGWQHTGSPGTEVPCLLSCHPLAGPLHLLPPKTPSPWDALCLKPRWGTLSMGVCRSFMNL